MRQEVNIKHFPNSQARNLFNQEDCIDCNDSLVRSGDIIFPVAVALGRLGKTPCTFI